MKIIKLQSLLGVDVIYLFLTLLVEDSENAVEELHPVETEKLDFLGNFRVYGFPEEFDAEEEDFPIGVIFFDQVNDLREHDFKDFIEKLFFLWLNGKLEGCGNCN